MKKIKDLEPKQKCEALTNYYNQCHPLNYGRCIFEVMEIELCNAFSFLNTKQGYDYWFKLTQNV